MAGSSSRMKWVKTWRQTLVRRDRAATNRPHCVIGWACPALRRKVDFPPEFAPGVNPSPVAGRPVTSLPTTRVLQRQAGDLDL